MILALIYLGGMLPAFVVLARHIEKDVRPGDDPVLITGAYTIFWPIVAVHGLLGLLYNLSTRTRKAP